MKALVTGSAGFIGTHLVKALRAQGVDVIGVDPRLAPVEVNRFGGWDVEIQGLGYPERDDEGEYARPPRLEDLLQNISHIFHLGGFAGVQASWSRGPFGIYTTNNIWATHCLLDACTRQPHPPKVIYASSSSVYGDGDGPISPYGVSKKAGEDLMRVYAKRGVPTVSLRYFTVYGPGQRPDMAFRKWIEAAAKGEYLTVYGDGSQRRSFTYVEDVANATILAATADLPSGSVFDVGGPKSVTIGDAVAALRALLPYPVNVKFLPAQPGDPQHVIPDPTRQLPGWQPTTDLTRGLEQQIAWQLEVLHA